MVAPKLRPDKAQQQRQRQFAMSNEGQLVSSLAVQSQTFYRLYSDQSLVIFL